MIGMDMTCAMTMTMTLTCAPDKYVEKFFEDAMAALQDDQVCAIMDEERKINPKLPACPPKTVLQADMQWCEQVKQAIINM